MSDLIFYRGRTNKASFEAKQDGAALNLTGATLRFTAKVDPNAADASAEINKTLGSGITLTNTISGLGTVTVNPADTTAIANEKTKLSYELQVTLSSGEFYTLDLGNIFLLPPVVKGS